MTQGRFTLALNKVSQSTNKRFILLAFAFLLLCTTQLFGGHTSLTGGARYAVEALTVVLLMAAILTHPLSATALRELSPPGLAFSGALVLSLVVAQLIKVPTVTFPFVA